MKNKDKIELIILPPKEKQTVTRKEIAEETAKLIFLLYDKQ